uniref:Uncharacterized protein n=1 Tax=Echeneis naucrates TaxID=173247 RepID=A0A665V119_ECHNA
MMEISYCPHLFLTSCCTECGNIESRKCPQAEAPKNGGLVCATVGNNTYCKPMCNDGYDFGFMRRSRLFDVCSKQTGYKWGTQYIGGNTLAVNRQLHDTTIKNFTTELQSESIKGEPQFTCLVCG